MFSAHRFFFIAALLGMASNMLHAQAILQGTVSFLNSGSRPASGVDISAFGASPVATTESGMFILKFPDKRPGNKVKIIVGNKDSNGTPLELVNDKVLAQVRIPSNPDDDIIEIIVCKVGQRNEAALRYNGIIVKTINEAMDKRLLEIDKKLDAAKIDAETIVSLQNEKDKLSIERDSALAKAEEQALFIASINLDKANLLVKEAVTKVDSLQDIKGAIEILDSEMLLKAYEEAKGKIQKAKTEIDQIVEAYKLKIKLLGINFQSAEINRCCSEFENICIEQNYETFETDNCFAWAVYFRTIDKSQFNRTNLQPDQRTLNDALVSYADGNFDEAIKLLCIILEDNPINQRALYFLGVSYMSTGNYKKAIELLSPLSRLESSEFKHDALWNLGLCYIETENGHRDAREAFMKLANDTEYSNHKGAKAMLDMLLSKKD